MVMSFWRIVRAAFLFPRLGSGSPFFGKLSDFTPNNHGGALFGQMSSFFWEINSVVIFFVIDSDIAVRANEGQGSLGPILGLHLCLSPEDHTSQPRRTRIGFVAPQVAFKGVHVRAKT